jgi:hypothetical protein
VPKNFYLNLCINSSSCYGHYEQPGPLILVISRTIEQNFTSSPYCLSPLLTYFSKHVAPRLLYQCIRLLHRYYGTDAHDHIR